MPDNITNTSYILLDSDSDTQYGARAQYNCSTGYNATSGDGLITCQLNGQWTELSLVCELTNCGNPGSPTNGQAINNIFTFGSSVEFQCNTGYELTGNTSTFCHANGEWNASLPYCTLIDCGDPGIPNNGQVIGTNYTYNSTVMYSCDDGYILNGSSSLICLTDQWNDTHPSCDLIKCSDPGIPTNGIAIGNVFTFRSSVEFQCNTGYELTGNTSTFCHANGKWNASLPYCTLIDCGYPGIPNNGKAIGTSYTYNSTVMYSCDDGYVLNGSSSLICLIGEWNASVPNCILIDCGDPGSPNNGEAGYRYQLHI